MRYEKKIIAILVVSDYRMEYIYNFRNIFLFILTWFYILGYFVSNAVNRNNGSIYYAFMRQFIIRSRLLEQKILWQIIFLFFITIFFSFIYASIAISLIQVLHFGQELISLYTHEYKINGLVMLTYSNCFFYWYLEPDLFFLSLCKKKSKGTNSNCTFRKRIENSAVRKRKSTNRVPTQPC